MRPWITCLNILFVFKSDLALTFVCIKWYGILPQADVNILYIIVYYIVEMGMHIPIKFDLQSFYCVPLCWCLRSLWIERVQRTTPVTSETSSRSPQARIISPPARHNAPLQKAPLLIHTSSSHSLTKGNEQHKNTTAQPWQTIIKLS